MSKIIEYEWKGKPWSGLEILFGYGEGDEMDKNWENMINNACFGC